MLLSTNISFISNENDDIESIRIIKEAGFDAYDISLFKMFRLKDYWANGDNYREEAIKLREYADSIGIICNQAHAPFASSVGEPVRDAEIFDAIVRSMEIAAILGAKNIVIHPKQHLEYAEHQEELFKMNLEFYNSLLEYAERYNINIATENMWQYNSKSKSVYDSTCSRAWEFCKYIDAVNNKRFVGCLDIGHISLVNADIPEFIRAMGNKRLMALHIHDTDYVNDLHTIPFTQKIDYHSVATALAEIDYQGDFTFEAEAFTNGFPKELIPSAARFLADIGRYIISKIEEEKAKLL